MSGWWVVGSVSEAIFFGLLFLLGTASLTIVVTWQVFWPESTILGPGFGFWVMVIASISFMVIGLTAFVLQVSQTLASPERRTALASKVKEEHVRRAEGMAESNSTLPQLRNFTDSPGVELNYRLATQSGDSTPLILSSLFTTAWNAMVAVLTVFWVQGFLSDKADWLLNVLMIPFLLVSILSSRWFLKLFLQQVRIGKTAVEIDRLPLLPGERYQLYVCQYGRVTFSKLTVSLVAQEEATFEQGTDVRTEARETIRLPAVIKPRHLSTSRKQRGDINRKLEAKGQELKEEAASSSQIAEDSESSVSNSVPEDVETKRNLTAEPEVPLELDCTIRLPVDMMHSFQGEHSALVWKVVVEGESAKWPGFCRKFPVVVYPRSAV